MRTKSKRVIRSRPHPALSATKRRRSFRREQRGAKYVYGARQFAALSPAEREARDEALEVVSLLRRERLSFTRAVRQVATTSTTVWRYAGVALRRARTGRIVVKPADRLYRRIRILTTEGLRDVGLRGSRVASIVGAHWNAVKKYAETGDESNLSAFSDVFPGGKRLATDPAMIDSEARRGELDFEDIYDSTV